MEAQEKQQTKAIKATTKYLRENFIKKLIKSSLLWESSLQNQ
jgi:hypothetical protein